PPGGDPAGDHGARARGHRREPEGSGSRRAREGAGAAQLVAGREDSAPISCATRVLSPMLLARLHTDVRGIHPGFRLLICAVVGGVLFDALRQGWGIAQAAALGWIVAVLLFLLLTVLAVGVASPDRLRARARVQDAS